ncbi:hypothetical protein [Verrucosispora sp. WMMC514]|uniref:hypothetical protein n=1 Tax=Verrucosispora sp. WMMC514 TaxID=3015156 RepID=UPI00248C2C32|nr:hypothetical protein [Verrucosispora sp. WMMC514]WBB89931.1 hypothetical protein O7597_23540 [Verrucosispora sp. WMMC514]
MRGLAHRSQKDESNRQRFQLAGRGDRQAAVDEPISLGATRIHIGANGAVLLAGPSCRHRADAGWPDRLGKRDARTSGICLQVISHSILAFLYNPMSIDIAVSVISA